MSNDIFTLRRRVPTTPFDRQSQVTIDEYELESGGAYDRISFDKSVFIQNISDASKQPTNGYRHYQASVADCRAGFSESSHEHEWLIVFAAKHAMKAVGTISEAVSYTHLTLPTKA